ncbi:uncharacterized protein LOC128882672 isoform X2 [Hylaeus volcanicus]|uniref:uncharacterized protein LOC128882672 isoform X2 n=1 Tax=Hylaeus volcanicus TaxID=313075 RepID=UPI0023B87F15|nr:uncharacterized protein LOC128882672 isoform X2 [Hylaeus volcanicus]
MGLFDFIEKEVSLIPLIECHETSKTILSKMILSNNIFVLPLLLLILKSENTQDWIKSTYHGFKNIAVQLQSQSFSTSLYKKFQLCKSTVSQAKQNLFETYWQQVFHYESQCFCECLYEDIMNCQIMMVRQHELNVENNTMLHEAIFLNDENLSRTHQNVATKHSEQTECLQQMENDFTQNNFEKSFEKGQSPSVEVTCSYTVSCKRNSGNNDHLGDCGNIFLNEIDRNKRGPYEENDIWFPTKVSDALFTLLYTANHHLSVLYEEAKVLLSSFPHSIMESFQEEIRTSLVHYLDQLASDMYLHLWTNKHLFDFPQHLRLNAVAQCLLDISTIRLLYPVNKDYRLSATEKYLREEYLEDIIDQIIFTESKITYAAQCFLETCRFLLLPLLVCHNIQRGLVPMKAEHEGMLCRVNDLCKCEVEKKKIQLIKDACQVNEVVWEEKEKNNSKDNSVVTKLNTCSNIQSQHMVSPCKKTNAKSDKTPYLNVSSFSSFLRGQVEELSSKVSEVMKQRSSNNNPL